ncbi:hypothetical protein F7230_07130 [Corynebacterium sp. 320]|nr:MULTISPECIES: hypothetical protein [Corynebacterium]KAB1502776.1 hypothetical protein F7230_07130 [Corynebacterium sp. 320]KAB1550483.1 hypothetical protein F7232_09380 [Corynebacterium sp. 319]KAB1554786.1 hypothetical protein F7233_00445 [Corynebacterium sp. 321]KAB3526439.1 hypothetical protein F8354_07130 [Corynebacterium sp. 250]KAB3539758.1 hypothetical protein F8390_00180 [Corynebacterium sp. 366]
MNPPNHAQPVPPADGTCPRHCVAQDVSGVEEVGLGVAYIPTPKLTHPQLAQNPGASYVMAHVVDL